MRQTSARAVCRLNWESPGSNRLDTDVVIIGGGVIGLAIARQLALQPASPDIILIEKEKNIGSGISSRSSEVIHAGLYYPKQYLKTTLCVDGNRLLKNYCVEKNIPHRYSGKIIVANSDEEHEFLHALALRAEFNGVTDLQWLTAKKLAEIEPSVKAKAAIFSPSTGVIDSAGLMQALLADAKSKNTNFALNTRVIAVTPDTGGLSVSCTDAMNKPPYSIRARVVINAAGLCAIDVARSINGFPAELLPTMLMAKGDYFSYSGKNPFRHLIYPVPAGQPMSSPNSEHAALGIHATVDLQNQLRFGPDITIVDNENYRIDENKRNQFADVIRRYFPMIEADKLQPAYAGIRPRLASTGKKTPDFMVQTVNEHGIAGLINLFGIESPGITCCLALAKLVSRKIY